MVVNFLINSLWFSRAHSFLPIILLTFRISRQPSACKYVTNQRAFMLRSFQLARIAVELDTSFQMSCVPPCMSPYKATWLSQCWSLLNHLLKTLIRTIQNICIYHIPIDRSTFYSSHRENERSPPDESSRNVSRFRVTETRYA